MRKSRSLPVIGLFGQSKVEYEQAVCDTEQKATDLSEDVGQRSLMRKARSLPDISLFLQNKVDYEQAVWDTEQKASDLPDDIGQQSLIQKTLLFQLAVKNTLESYVPRQESARELFSQIMCAIDIDPTRSVSFLKADLADPIDRLQIIELIKRAHSLQECISKRFTERSAAIEWYTPESIHFLNVGSVRVKTNQQILFPFLSSSEFQTSPPLKHEEKFLIAMIDCECSSLQSKLLETYIKNVASTLESAIKNQNNIKGAALIIKGRISKRLLSWFRGSSLLESTSIPNVEIIYAVPLLENDKSISPRDYLFTLKQGTPYRLKKNNRKIITDKDLSFYDHWQVMRPFVVIDQIVNEVVPDSSDYITFVNGFWEEFSKLGIPYGDYPDFASMKQGISEDELNTIVTQKVEHYRKELQEKAQSKNVALAQKSSKLLDKITGDIVVKISMRVRAIAEKGVIDNNLFYLDWNHIIYDAIKEKSYDLDFDPISSLSPQSLNDNNMDGRFFRNICIFKIDGLSEAYDGKFNIQFSEKLYQNGNLNDYSNRLFNWTLFNIIAIYMQIPNEVYNVAFVENLINEFLDNIFMSVDKSNYKLFYAFCALLETAYNVVCGKVDPSSVNKENEILTSLIEVYKNPHNAPMFKLNVLVKFMKCLKTKLELLKSENTKLVVAEDDGFDNDVFDFDEMQTDTQTCGPVNEQNSTNLSPSSLSQDHSEKEKSEAEIVAVLENTPLLERLSFNDIKSLLRKYEKTFDVVTLSPSSDGNSDYLKIKTLNQLVSYWNNNPVWRYFYFFNTFSCSDNIVKYIYVITSDDKVIVANEKLLDKSNDRPCHSQLAKGLGVKAAGELIFQLINNKWHLVTINNGSGHYRPPAHLCLPRVKDIICANLHPDIVSTNISLLNSLKPGMTLASGWDDNDDLYITSIARQQEDTAVTPPLTEIILNLMAETEKVASFYMTRDEIKFSIEDENSYYTADLVNILSHSIQLRHNNITVYPSLTTDQIPDLQQRLGSQTTRFAFIPLNAAFCSENPKHKNHWVAIVIDKELGLLFYIDPAAKNNIPPEITSLAQALKIKLPIIVSIVNLQLAEAEEGWLRHCGPYVIEIFNAIADRISNQQYITGGSLPNDDLTKDSISLQTALSPIPSGRAENILSIRRQHIKDLHNFWTHFISVKNKEGSPQSNANLPEESYNIGNQLYTIGTYAAKLTLYGLAAYGAYRLITASKSDLGSFVGFKKD